MADDATRARLFDLLRLHWGFDALRPMQEESIRANLDARDSLVVLPTGAGKSLCYQLPAMMREGLDVIVSPLISLMKDQVDGLISRGCPAVALHSGLTPEEQTEAERAIEAREVRMVFAAPERLLTSRMRAILRRAKPASIVVDEAHCISHWGHDFRPEYRRLTDLKQTVPDAAWHAFTATATERVRTDIARQLGLRDPAILVGDCDRPNLVYRVLPRVSGREQLLEIVKRHEGRAVIVYCISRKDTETMAAWLTDQGVQASAYHAGLSATARQRVQDRFMQERLQVVVATVAFGMGIDRSDVRCVIHMAMPKSVEHYQQEAGRAGRDGLEAECTLLYSSADVSNWRRLMQHAARENGDASPPQHQIELLDHMRRFCSTMTCRHRALAAYFGQAFDKPNCGACDICLEECEVVADSVVVAQKILSCVARLRVGFGAAHIGDVLRGANKERIRRLGHDALSVYGLMAGTPSSAIQSYIDQLCDQGALERTTDEMPVVRLTECSGEYLRGERPVTLRSPRVAQTRAESKASGADWEGVDRDLFDRLRSLRREISQERAIPAYLVFDDATLREMARRRPATRDALLEVKGVGQRKLEEFGDAFLGCIGAR